jgi:hypothetical protein
MNKESIILRQEVDCNCNDCGHFVRSIEALNASKKRHRQWAFLGIRTRRRYFWEEAQKALGKGKLESYRDLLRERSRVTVDKSYNPNLIFGACSKFNKPIETVPNVCQVDTQECFIHRRRLSSGT